MKIEILSGILTCVNLILVHGQQDCATNNPHKNSTRRILYGERVTKLDAFPWMVRLDIAGSTCGGAIIADFWVLTAAHCVYMEKCPDVRIHPAAWGGARSANAVQCLPHPYFTTTLAYDIGMVKVGENLLRGGLTRTISLPRPGAVFPPNSVATIAGYGQTELNGNYENHLYWGEFKVEAWDYCNNQYAYYCARMPGCIVKNIPRRILCVRGVKAPPPTTCFGDSGSPVVVNNVVAGIDSSGMPAKTCPPGAPSLHTTVADYLPWIMPILNPGFDSSRIPVQPEPEY